MRRVAKDLAYGLAVAVGVFVALMGVVRFVGLGTERRDQPGQASQRTRDERLYPARPVPGLSGPGKVVSVYDGDTLTVDVTIRLSVRLVGVWTPEIRGPQKDAGMVARGRLERLIAGRENCVVGVRTDRGATVGDATSMGRVLAEIWMGGDAESLNRGMIRAGYGADDAGTGTR